MSHHTPESRLFGILGTAAAFIVIFIFLLGDSAEPVLTGRPTDAEQVLTEFAACVSAHDMAGASSFLYGTPELTGATDSPTAAGILWDRYLSGLSCSFSSTLSATATGICGVLRIHGADLDQAVVDIEVAVPGLAASMAGSDDAARDASGSWTQEFLDRVMTAAAEQISLTPVDRNVTVQLIRTTDGWQILPGTELLSALAGGLS